MTSFFQIRVFLPLVPDVNFFVEVPPSLLVVQVPFLYDGFLSREVGCYCGDYRAVVSIIFSFNSESAFLIHYC